MTFALHTFGGVDVIMIGTLRDGVNRAYGFAGAAADAGFGNM